MEHPLQAALGRMCCAAPASAAPAQPAPPPRRSRLAELDTQFHCSLIGTCLPTDELRRLVPRHVRDLDRQRASDLELHHEAVRLAHAGGDGAKALHKALDQRHALAVKRSAGLADEAALAGTWQAALASGDIPGPYWALMTHALATPALRTRAFGDVHMLSHLVGAANRADIRRLQMLEHENGLLHQKAARQQQRIQALVLERDALAERQPAASAQAAVPAPALTDPALARLQAELAAREQALAHHTGRRSAAEAQMLAERDARMLQQQRLDHALALVEALQAEAQAAESAWARHLHADAHADTGPPPAPRASLQGRRVVYVGGRPRSNHSIRAIVQAEGGELLLHDGGIEDRKGLLAAALRRADLVVFPVDCVDHDSMATVKRSCERHGVPFHALRSASTASFLALLARLEHAAAAAPAPPPSRFCPRHG